MHHVASSMIQHNISDKYNTYHIEKSLRMVSFSSTRDECQRSAIVISKLIVRHDTSQK